MPSGGLNCCIGGPCRGGGYLLCERRDPKVARIALILDSYGGTRTIVGTSKSIKANTRHDEICHVVPKLRVHEPIAWNDIPIVIERAKVEFEKWLDTRPNLTEEEHHAITMYRLRCLEQRSSRHSFNPDVIVET